MLPFYIPIFLAFKVSFSVAREQINIGGVDLSDIKNGIFKS